MSPLVYIVVLNWNGWRDTLTCLDSLRHLEYSNYKIVVVDNASSDGSEQKIRSAYPDIVVLQSGANLGFSGGNNVGIRFAMSHGAEFVWILNNDTRVDPSALREMTQVALSDRQIGAVGSVIYHMNDPDKIQAWGGGRVNTLTAHCYHFTTPVVNAQLHFLTGASMLLRSATLQHIGLLDSNYFMYWEDVDLSFRLRKAGWKLCVAPNACVLHKWSASIKQKGVLIDSLFSESLARFLKLHAPLPILSVTMTTLFRISKRLAQTRWEHAYAVWKSAINGYTK